MDFPGWFQHWTESWGMWCAGGRKPCLVLCHCVGLPSRWPPGWTNSLHISFSWGCTWTCLWLMPSHTSVPVLGQVWIDIAMSAGEKLIQDPRFGNVSPVWCPWCYNLEYLQITRTGTDVFPWHIATTGAEPFWCRQIQHGALPGKSLVPFHFSWKKRWKVDQLGSANGFLRGKSWRKYS